MEALRLDPPIPLSTMLITTEDVRLGKDSHEKKADVLPKGTRFMFNFFQIHRDVTQYHHPAKFIPDRYSTRSKYYLTPGNE